MTDRNNIFIYEGMTLEDAKIYLVEAYRIYSYLEKGCRLIQNYTLLRIKDREINELKEFIAQTNS